MLVLASNSPRRKELLNLGGWRFNGISAEISEERLPDESPRAYVVRLAREKAQAALKLIHEGGEKGDFTILAADTSVVAIHNGEKDAFLAESNYRILGKPVDIKDAENMLRRLRGRTHEVLTGVCVLNLLNNKTALDYCRTVVHMRNYSDLEINDYLFSGDPLDKAGGYAIQHRDFNPVDRIEGCFANVMGLPLCMASAMLAEFGLSSEKDIPSICQHALDFECQVYTQWLNIS